LGCCIAASAPEVAVVTADLIGSRQHSLRDRSRVDAELRRTIGIATTAYRTFVHTRAGL